jgi:hypothetical protein
MGFCFSGFGNFYLTAQTMSMPSLNEVTMRHYIPLLLAMKTFMIGIVEVNSLYYIAGVTKDGMEMGCDFGFDMIERITLDDTFMEIPERVMRSMIVSKRFSYFGDKPEFPVAELVGKKARRLQMENKLTVSREHCLAAVVERDSLLAILKRSLIKVGNLPGWQSGTAITMPDLFSNIVIFHPQLLRGMLSRDKYGEWDHGLDRERALRVLNKFIVFLHENDNLRHIIIYNELTCPHWDASGEMHFDNSGNLVQFKYFGQGNGQSYKYYPQLEVWQRS